jgi:hypothetical protein
MWNGRERGVMQCLKVAKTNKGVGTTTYVGIVFRESSQEPQQNAQQGG